MKYCYVASPIDETNTNHAHEVELQLFQRQISSYSPGHAWSVSLDDLGPDIQQVNNEALKRASVLLAVLPVGIRTIGVPMEMMQARIDRIPVVVLSDRRRENSAALMEFPCDWARTPEAAADRVRYHLDNRPITWPIDEPVYTFIKTLNGENRVVETTDPMAHALEGKWTGDGDAPRMPDYPGDVGYDVTCAKSVWIEPGAQAAIPCDISIQLPPGYWGLMQGRSSSWRRGISVKASIMDAGYRGGVWVDCMNIGKMEILIQHGERIAQLIPMPVVPPIRWAYVEELDPSVRSDRGYGSTGK